MEKDVVIGGKLDLDLLRVVVGVEALATAEDADVDHLARPVVGCRAEGLDKSVSTVGCILRHQAARAGEECVLLRVGIIILLLLRADVDCHLDIVVDKQLLLVAYGELLRDLILALLASRLVFAERVVLDEELGLVLEG